MDLSPSEQQKELIALEESLWKDETRFDTVYMENILHPDFFEFGRSGRIYERSHTIYVPRSDINAIFPLKDLTFHQVSQDTILITYKSRVQYETLEIGNRSSLWVKIDGVWKLRFHQ